MKTGFLLVKECLEHKHHPEVPERVVAIGERLEKCGLLSKLSSYDLHSNPIDVVTTLHTKEHAAAIEAIPGSGKAARFAVAGVLGAVKAVSEGKIKNAFCAIRPPGHHATNLCKEQGYCYYANTSVAARYAQSLGHKKVLIIDWDFHHGNGAEDFFYDDPTVFTFSTHHAGGYPFTGLPERIGEGAGKGFNMNCHLDVGAEDSDMINVWKTKLLPAMESFKPDFILISAGFDSRERDKLGCWNISDKGYFELTRLAMQMADKYCNGRIVSALEGGYNPIGVSRGAVAHIAALMNEPAIPDDFDPTPGELQPKDKPAMRFGWIFFPDGEAEKIASIEMRRSDNSLVYNLPVTNIKMNAVNTKLPSLEVGSYINRLIYKDGRTIESAFDYEQVFKG
ncbi:MAG: histone deacetylase [Fibrobacteres bacterium]|nr:histone deacetylase [Fibrobacterota bacterium]